MDDDAYGCDLVLAYEYSQAHLVQKTPEFTYLAASNVIVRLIFVGSEKRDETHAAPAASCWCHGRFSIGSVGFRASLTRWLCVCWKKSEDTAAGSIERTAPGT